MLAFCVESSHARGMGHLYRALNLIHELHDSGCRCVLFINDHPASMQVVKDRAIPYETVPLLDESQLWERDVAGRHGVTVWINDRLDTSMRHAQQVKELGLPLATFDDRGPGAKYADLHVAGLSFDPEDSLEGRTILRGENYLILNARIADNRRPRQKLRSILVTLGGSDTYGVTAKVLRVLGPTGRPVTVVLGPAFIHFEELNQVLTPSIEVKRALPSLVDEFARHDLAVTGGGITPFEANASGLPCIVIANETFEIPVARHLQKLGGSVFAGHHSAIDASIFKRELPIAAMSQSGLDHIPLDGTRRVAEAIRALC